jgi:hypothetical protein
MFSETENPQYSVQLIPDLESYLSAVMVGLS